MQLKEIVLHGFKSFAQPTRLTFKPGITAIIGANGQGKSNVTDAIRWVLGEQSLKQVRSKSSDDVIFSGPEGTKRSQWASVALTFDNESGRLPLDAPEVTITRKVHRGGEGEYLVNGDPMRLLDIQEALAEAGLGTKSYAVISQGTVDRYLIATPVGRRELFDEATGVKALQLKLNRAEQKLAGAQRQAKELNNVLAELEPRLKVLNRQMKRYDERSELVKKFETAQQQWYHAKWYQAEQELHQTKAAVEEAQHKIVTARSARERVEDKLLAQVPATPQAPPQTIVQTRRATIDFTDLFTRCRKLIQAILKDAAVERKELLTLNADLGDALDSLTEKRKESQPKLKSEDNGRAALKQALDAARQIEVEAERGGSAAETALEQARREYTELEGQLKRELSSEAIAQIQMTPPDEEALTVREQDVQYLANRLASIGELDPLIEQEYREVKERHEYLTHQLADATTAWHNTQSLVRNLKTDINQQFRQQFEAINKTFKHSFSQLFGGGTARLDLVEVEAEEGGEEENEQTNKDSREVAGIDITVQPPGKKTTHIHLLSGGEKALTSLALILAIVQVQRPPFVVLDEVDAALDESNSFRFASLIREYAQNTQYVLVTHNRETMELADILYGVAMPEKGISKIFSVNMAELAETENVEEMNV